MKKRIMQDYIVQFRTGGTWVQSENSGADRRYTQPSAKRRAQQQMEMYGSPGMVYRAKKVRAKK
jgi:hypothetical protein